MGSTNRSAAEVGRRPLLQAMTPKLIEERCTLQPEHARGLTLVAPRSEQGALEAGTVPVVTGFCGRAPDGATTTLGRGGSDLSATFLGAALEARQDHGLGGTPQAAGVCAAALGECRHQLLEGRQAVEERVPRSRAGWLRSRGQSEVTEL